MRKLALFVWSLSLLFFWVRPYAPVVGTALAIIPAFIGVIHRRKMIRFNSGALIIIAYAATLSFPTIVNDSWIMSIRLVATPLLITLLFCLVRPNFEESRILVGSLTIGSIFCATVMYFQVSAGSFDFSIGHFLTRNRGMSYYLIGTEARYGATVIAGLISAGFVSSVFMVISSQGIQKNIFTLISMYSLLLLVLTASRTAVAGSMLAIIFLFVAMPKEGGTITRNKLQTVAIGFAVIIIAIIAFRLALEYSPDAHKRYSVLLGGGAGDSLNTRFMLWGLAFDRFLEAPFGRGFNYFPARYNYSPHNELLAQLVGGGFLVTLLLIAIMFKWGVSCMRLLRKSGRIKEQGALLGSMYILSLSIGTTENFSVSSSSLYYFVFWWFAVLALANPKAVRYD